MSPPKSASNHWTPLRATLQDKLRSGHATLASAAANAAATFEDRLKKVHGPLAENIRTCHESARLNFQLAELQHKFLVQQLGTVDLAVEAADEEFRKARAESGLTDTFPGAEVVIVGPLMAETSKMVVDGLCLSWLLSALLGHKEAHAFVHGAKKELVGALGDPGAGVFTLLKRLYAVATRSLRQDQDAAELLQSLRDFSELMDKWQQVAGQMSTGVAFPEALKAVASSPSDA